MGKIWGITFIAAAALSLAASAPPKVDWTPAGQEVISLVKSQCDSVVGAIKYDASDDANKVRQVASDYCPR